MINIFYGVPFQQITPRFSVRVFLKKNRNILRLDIFSLYLYLNLT